MKKTVIQFITFSLVGIVGTSGHYITMVLLVEIFQYDILYATSIGFIVGACINYVLNYYVTFQSSAKHYITVIKYLSIAAIGMLLNGMLLYNFQKIMAVHYLLLQVVVTLLVLIWNYYANRLWTFNV